MEDKKPIEIFFTDLSNGLLFAENTNEIDVNSQIQSYDEKDNNTSIEEMSEEYLKYQKKKT